jgi:hypothetical protein
MFKIYELVCKSINDPIAVVEQYQALRSKQN